MEKNLSEWIQTHAIKLVVTLWVLVLCFGALFLYLHFHQPHATAVVTENAVVVEDYTSVIAPDSPGWVAPIHPGETALGPNRRCHAVRDDGGESVVFSCVDRFQDGSERSAGLY